MEFMCANCKYSAKLSKLDPTKSVGLTCTLIVHISMSPSGMYTYLTGDNTSALAVSDTFCCILWKPQEV